MPSTCSIPGCNGRNSFLKLSKLYKVPAVATGTSGLIYNLTNKRRTQWFLILEKYGLTVDNCSSFRVCENHFQEGKPSTMFDTKCKDWVPNIFPDSEDNITGSEDNGLQNKPKRKRSKKQETVMDFSSTKKTKLSTESVDNTEDIAGDDSADGSTKSDSFVFVDVKKIKEGTHDSSQKSASTSSKSRKKSSHSKSKRKGARSSGTQTDLSTSSLSKSGRTKLRKARDSTYKTVGVQTVSTNHVKSSSSEESSSQTCIGEMIEFIRKRMLDSEINVGKTNYKLRECSFHFEKEGEIDGDKDSENNTLIVHSNKLLSANWPLLQSVAVSLDLFRSKQKESGLRCSTSIVGNTAVVNDSDENGKYTIEETSIGSKAHEVLTISDEENQNELENSPLYKMPAMSPIIPKITNVVSLREMGNSSSEKTDSANEMQTTSRFINTPSYVNRLSRQKNSSNKFTGISTRKSKRTVPRILAKNKKVYCKQDYDIQSLLGTTQVPRVILPKLPENLLKEVSDGGTIPLKNCGNFLKDINFMTSNKHLNSKITNSPSQLIVSQDLKNSPFSFKSLKNIPLKLPQTKDVAGYLLVPTNTDSSSNPSAIYYVPKLPVGDMTDTTSTDSKLNLPQCVNKAVSALLLPGARTPLSTPERGILNVVTNAPQVSKVITITSSTINSGISNVTYSQEQLVHSNLINMNSHSLPNSTALKENIEVNMSDKESKAAEVDKNVHTEQDQCSTLKEDTENAIGDELSKVKLLQTLEGNRCIEQNTEHTNNHDLDYQSSLEDDTLIRCVDCGKLYENASDLKKHYKSVDCKRTLEETRNKTMIKCKLCGKDYKKESEHSCKKSKVSKSKSNKCNVCEREFDNASQLKNHLKTHIEYFEWTESCHECALKFPKPQDLAQHIEQLHAENTHECQICNLKFSKPNKLTAHMQKDHRTARTKTNIRIRCKICKEVFDLEQYRKVHWKQCQEKKHKDEFEKIMENTTKKKTNKMICKLCYRIFDQEYYRNVHWKQCCENVFKEGSEEVNGVGTEKDNFNNESQKILEKPKAIRSKYVDKDHRQSKNNEDSIEARLARMFSDDKNSSGSEYEMEEVLKTNFEIDEIILNNKFPESTINIVDKVGKTKTNSDNVYTPVKICSFDNSSLCENVLNNDQKIDLRKIDIQSLLNIEDGSNDITIEEMDDEEYFST